MLTELGSLVRSDGSANRLRVLLITARADHGGGPRHILDLLRAFESSGIEFYIASPEQEPYASQFHRFTKKFFELPPRSFSLVAFFRLLRVVRRARVDVIHSHGRGAGIYSRLLGLFTGVRVLHTFHGIHREPSLNGRLKLLVDQVLSYFPFTPIYVSENESREAVAFGCVRPGVVGFVIENAVDASRFKIRTNPPMSGQVLRIGAFVRNDPVKNPDLFLNLARELGREGQWTCAGISRAELSQYGAIPEALEIMDRLQEPAAWLESLDIFVSTSRNEGLPLGVLEAMAAGCLCILSDIPAHVNFKDAALLFNAEDKTSFLDALSRPKNDLSLRATLFTKAFELIATRHSLETFAHKLERAYSVSASK
jgi:glycosyltransferase involved in cell wall biosynthesis